MHAKKRPLQSQPPLSHAPCLVRQTRSMQHKNELGQINHREQSTLYSTVACPASELVLETDMDGSTAIISARMSRMGYWSHVSPSHTSSCTCMASHTFGTVLS